MKKHLILSTLALAGLAQAAPFSGEGLSADRAGLVHIDFESPSKLVSTFRSIAEEAAAKQGGAVAGKDSLAALKKAFGVKSDKDVHDLTLVVLPGAGEPDATLRVRGVFNRAAFESISKDNPTVKAHKLGKTTWYAVPELVQAYAPDAKDNGKSKGCVAMLNDSTVIVTSDEAGLAKAVKAAESKASVTIDATAKSVFSSKAMVSGYFPEAFVKAVNPSSAPVAGKPAKPEVLSVAFILGETGGNLMLKAKAKFDSEAGAKQTQAQAGGMLGFFQMGLANAKPDATEKQQADQQFLLALLQALKFDVQGNDFVVNFSYPAEVLVKKLEENRAEIIAGMDAKKSMGPAPARVGKVRPAGKARPAPVSVE